jgi:uncharacterized BrkB/YihY/UPF0761 family membrane protein
MPYFFLFLLFSCLFSTLPNGFSIEKQQIFSKNYSQSDSTKTETPSQEYNNHAINAATLMIGAGLLFGLGLPFVIFGTVQIFRAIRKFKRNKALKGRGCLLIAIILSLPYIIGVIWGLGWLAYFVFLALR